MPESCRCRAVSHGRLLSGCSDRHSLYRLMRLLQTLCVVCNCLRCSIDRHMHRPASSWRLWQVCRLLRFAAHGVLDIICRSFAAAVFGVSVLAASVTRGLGIPARHLLNASAAFVLNMRSAAAAGFAVVPVTVLVCMRPGRLAAMLSAAGVVAVGMAGRGACAAAGGPDAGMLI